MRGAGALTVLTVGGGVFYARERGVFRVGEGAAYEPWQSWNQDAAHGPLALVRAGILACSPHNTQPWLFRVSDQQIELYADLTRTLGAMDPYRRELHLGLGCALENMVLAGQAHGYACVVDLVPGRLSAEVIPDASGPVRVATLHLQPGPATASDLHDAIPHRHTNRGPYDPTRSVGAAALTQLRTLATADTPGQVHLLTTDEAKIAFSRHTLAATQTIISDAAMSAASHRWFRLTSRASDTHRDGVTLEGAGLSPLTLRLAKLLPGLSSEKSDAIWLRNTREQQLPTAAAFGLLTVPDRYDAQQALQAGRLWQRLHLRATTLGLALQPLNQLVEVADRDQQLGRPAQADQHLASLLPAGAGQVTFGFRLGYPQRPAVAVPRRSLAQVLLRPVPATG